MFVIKPSLKRKDDFLLIDESGLDKPATLTLVPVEALLNHFEDLCNNNDQ